MTSTGKASYYAVPNRDQGLDEMKFHGDPESLHVAVNGCQLVGEWTETGNKHCFRAKTGET
jgi:hypothetical protein